MLSPISKNKTGFEIEQFATGKSLFENERKTPWHAVI